MGSTNHDAVWNLFPLRFDGRSVRQYAGIGGQAKLPEYGLCTRQKHGGRCLARQERRIFQALLFRVNSLLSSAFVGQPKKDVSFEEFYAFDSSTFTLFSEVMKGVGRNPKDEGKKKGGLKVHMLTDVHADTAVLPPSAKPKCTTRSSSHI